MDLSIKNSNTSLDHRSFKNFHIALLLDNDSYLVCFYPNDIIAWDLENGTFYKHLEFDDADLPKFKRYISNYLTFINHCLVKTADPYWGIEEKKNICYCLFFKGSKALLTHLDIRTFKVINENIR